ETAAVADVWSQAAARQNALDDEARKVLREMEEALATADYQRALDARTRFDKLVADRNAENFAREQFDYKKTQDQKAQDWAETQFDYQKDKDKTAQDWAQTQFDYKKGQDQQAQDWATAQFDYKKYMDEMARAWTESQFDYKKTQDQLAQEWAEAQFNARQQAEAAARAQSQAQFEAKQAYDREQAAAKAAADAAARAQAQAQFEAKQAWEREQAAQKQGTPNSTPNPAAGLVMPKVSASRSSGSSAVAGESAAPDNYAPNGPAIEPPPPPAAADRALAAEKLYNVYNSAIAEARPADLQAYIKQLNDPETVEILGRERCARLVDKMNDMLKRLAKK
ncbi:MAG: hypothetical protein FWD16_07455, partial [Clostridia bacterium]|nr:hypothetical protein [Clostridia bacterium]